MDREEDIVLVVLAIEESLQPERPEFLVEMLYLSLQLCPEALILLA